MTINSEQLDRILDEIEAEVPGENRGNLVFRGDNEAEFDFEITETADGVNIYHDTVLLEEIVYDEDNRQRFIEDLLDAVIPYLED